MTSGASAEVASSISAKASVEQPVPSAATFVLFWVVACLRNYKLPDTSNRRRHRLSPETGIRTRSQTTQLHICIVCAIQWRRVRVCHGQQ